MVISIRSSKAAAHDHSGSDEIPVVSAGIASSAIIAGKIGPGAIDDSTMLADAVVAPGKVADVLRTNLYVGDETETTSTNTSFDSIKTFKLIRDPTLGLDPTSLKWQVELRSSTETGTASFQLQLDGAAAGGTLEVSGVTYGLVTGSTLVSLTTGTHTVDVQVQTTSGGTAYSKLFELYSFT